MCSWPTLRQASPASGRARPATAARSLLDLKVKGQQLTGTFTLAQQTVDIADGKVADKTFSFKVTIEGRSPHISGELVGEQVKLTVEGVSRSPHAETREVGAMN